MSNRAAIATVNKTFSCRREAARRSIEILWPDQPNQTQLMDEPGPCPCPTLRSPTYSLLNLHQWKHISNTEFSFLVFYGDVQIFCTEVQILCLGNRNVHCFPVCWEPRSDDVFAVPCHYVTVSKWMSYIIVIIFMLVVFLKKWGSRYNQSIFKTGWLPYLKPSLPSLDGRKTGRYE